MKACWTGKSSGNYCIEQRSFTLFIPCLSFSFLTPRRPYKSTLRCKMQNYICLPLLGAEWVGTRGERGKKSGRPEKSRRKWSRNFSDIALMTLNRDAKSYKPTFRLSWKREPRCTVNSCSLKKAKHLLQNSWIRCTLSGGNFQQRFRSVSFTKRFLRVRRRRRPRSRRLIRKNS